MCPLSDGFADTQTVLGIASGAKPGRPVGRSPAPPGATMTQTSPAPADDGRAPSSPPAAPTAAPTLADRAARLGVDWWAVIVAGAFVALAALDVLPTIGW